MKKMLALFVAVMATMAVMAQERVSTAQFEKKVGTFAADGQHFNLASDKPIILDFYATWCGPCKMLTPELHALLKEYKDQITLYKIDVDADIELAKMWRIRAMPTLIFLNTDGTIYREVGYRTKDELKKIVKEFLKL